MEFPAGGTRYLTTLVCEGGLPRLLLRQQEAHITRFLRRGLEQREAAQRTSTTDLLKAEVHLLPSQFQNPVVIQTCSDLIDRIAGLRASLGGASEADPVARLDKLEPTWRLRVPLRFDDDDNARSLLEGLVGHKVPPTPTSRSISISTVLDFESEGGPRVLRRIDPMREVSEAALAAFVGIEKIPSLATLSVRIGGAEQLPVLRIARQQERNGAPFYRLDPLRSILPSGALSANVDWILETAGQRIHRWPASLAPLGELPLVFRCRADGVWTLAAEEVLK